MVNNRNLSLHELVAEWRAKLADAAISAEQCADELEAAFAASGTDEGEAEYAGWRLFKDEFAAGMPDFPDTFTADDMRTAFRAGRASRSWGQAPLQSKPRFFRADD